MNQGRKETQQKMVTRKKPLIGKKTYAKADVLLAIDPSELKQGKTDAKIMKRCGVN